MELVRDCLGGERLRKGVLRRRRSSSGGDYAAEVFKEGVEGKEEGGTVINFRGRKFWLNVRKNFKWGTEKETVRKREVLFVEGGNLSKVS